jgi:hypothetical protein
VGRDGFGYRPRQGPATKRIQTLKAVGQNLMHSNLSITDGVYGVLSSADIELRIKAIGKKLPTEQISSDDLGTQLIELGLKLKRLSFNSA